MSNAKLMAGRGRGGAWPGRNARAKYVMATPAAVVDQTITGLAASCSTSIASVARFCRHVGFAGNRQS